jgi:hypothetical protein
MRSVSSEMVFEKVQEILSHDGMSGTSAAMKPLSI